MGRWLSTCLVCQLIIPWHLGSAAAAGNATYLGSIEREVAEVDVKVRYLPDVRSSWPFAPIEASGLRRVGQSMEVCRPVMEVQETASRKGCHLR